MPLNTLRKDRSKHFSGRVARLASCIVCLSVKNKSVKLPFDANKQKIMLHAPAAKTRNLIGCLWQIQFDWCDIHTSLTHSLIHIPAHNIP